MVSGYVNPGAGMKVIIQSGKDDVIVVWGGSNDINKQNSQEALRQLSSFVNKNHKVNVIVVSPPLRHELMPSSCVNSEVIRFNRLLRKRMKIYKNITIIDSDLHRDCFTRHGLHLNSAGKYQIVLKLVNVIENLSVRGNESTIKLQWKESEISLEYRDSNQIPEKGDWESSVTNQVLNGDNKEPVNEHQLRISNRTKLMPRTMTIDFLWEIPLHINL
jgi:hypothetical protein